MHHSALLQKKLRGGARSSDLKKTCDVNGSLDLIKEFACTTKDCSEDGKQHGNFALQWTIQGEKHFLASTERGSSNSESEFGSLIPGEHKHKPLEQKARQGKHVCHW